MNLSNRVARVGAFRVMALLARAKELEAQGRDIIHMEVGEPDFPTPEAVLREVALRSQTGLLHYTPAQGLLELRELISKHYQAQYGVEVSANRIIVTPGASGALLLALSAVADVGESILVTDPGYPCNREIARMLGLIPQAIPLSASHGYQPDVGGVERFVNESPEATFKALMLASPMNPTGTSIPNDILRQLIQFGDQRDIVPVVDEIYHGLYYGEGRCHTALEHSDNVFVINSFSKYFGLTGWRIGWLVAPESAVDPVIRLAQNLFLAASTPGQFAAIAAMSPEVAPIHEERRRCFAKRREYLLAALRKLGFVVPCEPDGAFYIYADASRFTDDAETLVSDMMESVGVVATPAIDFGDNNSRAYIRFAFTQPLIRLQEAVQRMQTYLRNP